MRQIVRIVGWALVALVFAGLCLEVIAAHLAGKPFYGQNYRMLDLGTYSTALSIIIVSCIGLIVAAR